MSDNPNAAPRPVPPDDHGRNLTLSQPDEDENLPHIGMVGDTYTILLRGEDTAGRYTLIDMRVPQGGGPPPHRHDFEEMFHVLEGEIETTFRGEKSVVREKRSTSRPTRRTRSPTPPNSRRVCSAYARRPARRSSSRRSASP